MRRHQIIVKTGADSQAELQLNHKSPAGSSGAIPIPMVLPPERRLVENPVHALECPEVGLDNQANGGLWERNATHVNRWVDRRSLRPGPDAPRQLLTPV